MSVRMMMQGRKPAGGGSGFDPTTITGWHSLFWAEGSDMTARGYADGAAVATWDNETGETDATTIQGVTYAAAYAGLNSQPSLAFSTSKMSTGTFASNPTYPISIVAICYAAVSPGWFIFDGGTGGGGRNAVYYNTGTATIFAGSALNSGVALGVGAHAIVAKFDGRTGNETLRMDGTQIVNANAGSGQITGLSIGQPATGLGQFFVGAIAFLGIYSGDITADGSWADLVTWANDHYGVTL